MAILFWIFLDQICPKWIKLANSVNRHLEFSNSSPKGLISSESIILLLGVNCSGQCQIFRSTAAEEHSELRGAV